VAVRTPAAAASEAGAVLSALVLADLLLDGGIVQGDDAETEASEVAASAQRRSERQPDPLDGLPIVRIVLVRRDIFDTNDPSTDAWPYRLANALHVTSTEALCAACCCSPMATRTGPSRPKSRSAFCAARAW
jgi:hypothetical protein